MAPGLNQHIVYKLRKCRLAATRFAGDAPIDWYDT